MVVARTGATYGKTLYFEEDYPSVFASFLIRFNFNPNKIINKYYWIFTLSNEYRKQKESLVQGGGQPQFNANAIKKIRIPVPSIEVQKEIISEIESYLKIFDGARQVVNNYKPVIMIDSEWDIETLGELCIFKRGPFGGSLKKEIFVKDGFKVFEQKHAIKNDFTIGEYYITKEKYDEMIDFALKANDLIISFIRLIYP